VGHHLAALTRLRQLLERKSFSPSVARAPALSVLVNSPHHHHHTHTQNPKGGVVEDEEEDFKK
jgi:hypothetical protein